jgi:hypothetical protein
VEVGLVVERVRVLLQELQVRRAWDLAVHFDDEPVCSHVRRG